MLYVPFLPEIRTALANNQLRLGYGQVQGTRRHPAWCASRTTRSCDLSWLRCQLDLQGCCRCNGTPTNNDGEWTPSIGTPRSSTFNFQVWFVLLSFSFLLLLPCIFSNLFCWFIAWVPYVGLSVFRVINFHNELCKFRSVVFALIFKIISLMDMGRVS